MNTAAWERVAQLEQVFARIGGTRMKGVPVLHSALRVQAVGFEIVTDADALVMLGILITPWFMNLLRLPLLVDGAEIAEPGSKRGHRCGEQLFEFIAAHEAALGRFEACSLFSPMFEFADQAGAVCTATEILKLLRAPPAREATPVVPAPSHVSTTWRNSAPTPAAPVSNRRGFLLGRVPPSAVP